MILALLISRLDVGFVFFKWVALVFCPRRPRGLVRASSGALVWKHVICGCCRVTSQKKLSYRLQALSSLFFEVMPSIIRIRLDGWFSRCRGQSSGKSASRQRASQERRSTRKVTSAVQAMFKRCSRESFATGALFSTVQLGPAHGQLVESDCPYGAEPRPCPGFLGLMSKWSNISFIPWKIQTYRLYICLVTHDAEV